MAQQQQSNNIKPQVIGSPKAPMTMEQAMSSSKGAYWDKSGGAARKNLMNAAKKVAPKPVKKITSKKMPTMSQVQKSVKKTMGYK